MARMLASTIGCLHPLARNVHKAMPVKMLPCPSAKPLTRSIGHQAFKSIGLTVHQPSSLLQHRQSIATRALATDTATAAEAGDYVQVHYTGTLEDGTVFDSSREREPLDFIIGEGFVVKGFDQAVTGLVVGGTRKQSVRPEDAYGQPKEEMIATVPAANAPEGLQVGNVVQLANGLTARVTSVTPEGDVTIDANHELAGKTLIFDVELMKLVKAGTLETATFGMGCFWGPQLAFQRVPGVVSTSVGYCNGSHPSPTYEDVCSGNTGHAEVVQVVYDPSEVSYKQLLDVFLEGHDPTQKNRQGNDVGTQYRSGIYTHTEEQMKVAVKAVEEAGQKLKGSIATELAPIDNYHRAEDYHQQYLARGGRFGRPQSARKGCDDPIRCYG